MRKATSLVARIASAARTGLAELGLAARVAPARIAVAALAALVSLPLTAKAGDGEQGLLFTFSADHGLVVDFARGEKQPNFADKVKVVPDGHVGAGLSAAG